MHDDLGGQGRTEESVQVFCKFLIAWYLCTKFPILRDLGGSRPKNRGMTRPRIAPLAADSLVLLASRRPAPLIIPTDTRTPFRVFRSCTLLRQLVAFQKRFPPLELPRPEIRSEFDRNASDAGMPQSEMPRLARCQEFHRLSMGRHRVLSRQSGGLKPKNPGPSRPSLLRLIFSAVAFVFSS
jgi:hypothetical protein